MISAVICMSLPWVWHPCNLPCVSVMFWLISIVRYILRSPSLCFWGTRYESCKQHIKNMSNTQLTDEQITLLSCGLKFIPVPMTKSVHFPWRKCTKVTDSMRNPFLICKCISKLWKPFNTWFLFISPTRYHEWLCQGRSIKASKNKFLSI